MTRPSYEDIISSGTFQFLVGPQKRLFTLHSSVVTAQSKALETLVKGNFREAEQGQAVLEEVDEQTFVAFSQFAYTSDYKDLKPGVRCHAAANGKRAREPEEQGGPPEVPYWSLGTPGRSSTESKKSSAPEDAFKKASFSDSRPQATYKAPRNIHPNEVYTDVLLMHARLYTFADCYGIPALMDLAIYKLHRTLVGFSLFRDCVPDVVHFLSYCLGDVPEKLRKLAHLYAGTRVEKLWWHADFKKLVDNSKELSVALIDLMVPRLRWLD